METFNPFEELMRWFTVGNIIFLSVVFIIGWLAGIATFACLLTKIIS